ncbi:MAG: HAMP domain-containing sensor histidine kinase [Parvularculaceae bacterium]
MILKRLVPQSIAAQMMAVLCVSFLLLLAVLTALEFLEYDNVADTAEGEFTTQRLGRILPILESIRGDDIETYLGRVSHCHDGYTLSEAPDYTLRTSEKTKEIATKIGEALSLNSEFVHVGFATFERGDFSYSECATSEIEFPLEGIVVSLRLSSGKWVNAEIHPHEWHFTPSMTDWLIRSGAAFLLIGGIALIFVRRLSKPFKNLTDAAKTFASDLKFVELEETGPPDIKRAISSFNMMQRQVVGEMKRRTNTLTAISHDIRSPLTALRVKAELIDNEEVRADHIASIEKMERITASALAFLKGESRNEPMKQVDLGILVESECADFRELGVEISFECKETIHYTCRPDALSRAIRNLIENAIKYAGNADVSINDEGSYIAIAITDTGPGIPPDKMADVLEPFERMSEERDNNTGGFGLGLTIAKAIIEGHDGLFELQPNIPAGLIVLIKLPV